MKIFHGEQRTDEWRKARAGLATASCFHHIMAQGKKKGEESVGRRNYRIQVALERMTGVQTSYDLSFNKDVVNGVEREPELRRRYELATDAMIDEVLFIQHDSLACGVSPDGLILPHGAIEGKCPAPPAHAEYLRLVDEPPSTYHWQVHGLMFVADLKWVDFVSFNPDFPPELQLHIVRVNRDDHEIALLREGLEQFLAEVTVTVNELRELADKRRLPQAA